VTDRDEWAYLTFDPQETCPVCSEPIHTAQAVGYQGGRMIHARCSEEDSDCPERAA